mmetsp:Transcript_6564/g.12974  ORF Transcript_6564/g.12974 Transcript_6564/m.12974 type:complete len:248 (+) Transcript_6564:575-1318(+)
MPVCLTVVAVVLLLSLSASFSLCCFLSASQSFLKSLSTIFAHTAWYLALSFAKVSLARASKLPPLIISALYIGRVNFMRPCCPTNSAPSFAAGSKSRAMPSRHHALFTSQSFVLENPNESSSFWHHAAAPPPFIASLISGAFSNSLCSSSVLFTEPQEETSETIFGSSRGEEEVARLFASSSTLFLGLSSMYGIFLGIPGSVLISSQSIMCTAPNFSGGNSDRKILLKSSNLTTPPACLSKYFFKNL